MAPAYISDEDLAGFPVIVVARWKQSAISPHHRVEMRDGRRTITGFECFTEIHVERVLSGDLKPGRHRLKIGYGIAWNMDGTGITTGTSTELAGDAVNLTHRNLWFLKWQRSWDVRDQTDYLSISNYRAIQPAALEKYFRALTSAQPGAAVPALLAARDADVVKRVLRLAAGGLWPWPYDDDFEAEYQGLEKGPVLREHAGAVAAVVKRRELRELRTLALAIFAEMAPNGDRAFIRSCLRDRSAAVRATAVALLVRARDTDSLPQMVTGREDPGLACTMIMEMSRWGDLRLVPALAAFLESDAVPWRCDDEIGMPALKARESLHRMTGHWFPFDVTASLAAWRKAASVSGPAARGRFLARMLPNDPNPLAAEVTGDICANTLCKITNQSKFPVTVTRFPEGWNAQWSYECGSGGGSSSSGGHRAKRQRDFIVLQPGESLVFSIHLRERFLAANPARLKLSLVYACCGHKWGLHAWMGRLPVKIRRGS